MKNKKRMGLVEAIIWIALVLPALVALGSAFFIPFLCIGSPIGIILICVKLTEVLK